MKNKGKCVCVCVCGGGWVRVGVSVSVSGCVHKVKNTARKRDKYIQVCYVVYLYSFLILS